MAELDSLVGSKISLISQQDCRYEGILFNINADESSIILKDVHCFGTEDREAAAVVPASSDILPFLRFPGADIKDLYVHEPAGEATPPPPEPKAVVPPSAPTGPTYRAPTSTAKSAPTKPFNPNEQQQSKKRNEKNAGDHSNKPTAQPNANSGVYRAPSSSNKPTSSSGNTGPKPRRGEGVYLTPSSLKSGASDTITMKEEFDFQAGLSKFNKEEVLSSVADGSSSATTTAEGSAAAPAAAPAAVKAYVKDDFFDTFVSTRDRVRPTMGEERTFNKDTFGDIAMSHSSHHGGRGRGRGGRGGRGYGRNNYHRNQAQTSSASAK